MFHTHEPPHTILVAHSGTVSVAGIGVSGGTRESQKSVGCDQKLTSSSLSPWSGLRSSSDRRRNAQIFHHLSIFGAACGFRRPNAERHIL